MRERVEEIGVSVVAPERRSPEYLEKFIVSEIEKMGRRTCIWPGEMGSCAIAEITVSRQRAT